MVEFFVLSALCGDEKDASKGNRIWSFLLGQKWKSQMRIKMFTVNFYCLRCHHGTCEKDVAKGG